jgi:hypothetical protein
VAFEEAAIVFGDLLDRILTGPRHSMGEERFVLPGFSRRQRLLALSVRRATRNRTHYQFAARNAA